MFYKRFFLTWLLLVLSSLASGSPDRFLDDIENLVETNQCSTAIEFLLSDTRSYSEIDDPKRQSMLYFRARGCVTNNDTDFKSLLETKDFLINVYQLKGDDLDVLDDVINHARERVYGDYKFDILLGTLLALIVLALFLSKRNLILLLLGKSSLKQ
jgi:hypothetical protein